MLRRRVRNKLVIKVWAEFDRSQVILSSYRKVEFAILHVTMDMGYLESGMADCEGETE